MEYPVMTVSPSYTTQTCRLVPINRERALPDHAPVTYVLGRNAAEVAHEHAVRLARWYEMRVPG
jgi:hypothetical protein